MTRFLSISVIALTALRVVARDNTFATIFRATNVAVRLVGAASNAKAVDVRFNEIHPVRVAIAQGIDFVL